MAKTLDEYPGSISEVLRETINETAEKVSSERQALVADFEAQEPKIRELLSEARETAVALTDLATTANTMLLSLDRFVGRLQDSEPEPDEESEGRPFDITEYGEAGMQIGEGAQNVTEMFASLGGLLESPSLKGEDSLAAVSMAEVRATGQAFMDRAFRYLLILLVLFFLGLLAVLLVYKFLSQRLGRSPVQPTGSSRGQGRAG
jgi:hypothetical protein